MVSLYRDPHGEHVLDTSDPFPLSTTLNTENNSTEAQLQLQARIVELESKLKQQVSVLRLSVILIQEFNDYCRMRKCPVVHAIMAVTLPRAQWGILITK